MVCTGRTFYSKVVHAVCYKMDTIYHAAAVPVSTFHFILDAIIVQFLFAVSSFHDFGSINLYSKWFLEWLCLFCRLMSQSTTMDMSRLSTLFLGRLRPKWLTRTWCTSFRQ